MVLCKDSSRAGLFMAIYRIIQDYYNPQAKELDIYQTVMQLMNSGLGLINSEDQYKFIFQCLHEEATKHKEVEESRYYSPAL